MTDFSTVKQNLERRGYKVQVFETKEAAAQYLNGEIDGTTVGFGGSGTLDAMGLYDLLKSHNTVLWHWKNAEERALASNTEVYLSSVNALAQSGDMISIDGVGNRIASMLYGHKKLYYVIGSNKLTGTFEEAYDRAKNYAAPRRAAQLKVKTPCAVKQDRCYDCSSPERICNGMNVLWRPLGKTPTEILLIDEALGL